MKILYALSATLFVLGCLVIQTALLVVWTYLMVRVASASVLMGWGLFVVSVMGWGWYQGQLQKPWQAWFQVWQWADAELHRRLVGGSHG